MLKRWVNTAHYPPTISQRRTVFSAHFTDTVLRRRIWRRATITQEEEQCSLPAYTIEADEGRRTNTHSSLTSFGRRRRINTHRPLTDFMRNTRKAHHPLAMQSHYSLPTYNC